MEARDFANSTASKSQCVFTRGISASALQESSCARGAPNTNGFFPSPLLTQSIELSICIGLMYSNNQTEVVIGQKRIN